MASVATATAAAAAASTTTVAAPDALATHAGGVDVGVSTSSPITTPAVVVTAAGTENGHAAAAPTAMSKAVAGGGGETGTARTLEPVRATDSWGVSVHVVRGRNLAAKDSNGKSDPYVKVTTTKKPRESVPWLLLTQAWIGLCMPSTARCCALRTVSHTGRRRRSGCGWFHTKQQQQQRQCLHAHPHAADTGNNGRCHGHVAQHQELGAAQNGENQHSDGDAVASLEHLLAWLAGLPA